MGSLNALEVKVRRTEGKKKKILPLEDQDEECRMVQLKVETQFWKYLVMEESLVKGNQSWHEIGAVQGREISPETST